MINLNQKIFGARNFIWHEALWLPSWKFHAFPEKTVKRNIEDVAHKLQMVRDKFGKSIFITSWYRPDVYNQVIGGAKKSAHVDGMAVDFIVKDMVSDDVRNELLPELDTLEIRMEDLPGSSWVHIDNREPKSGNRFFKP